MAVDCSDNVALRTSLCEINSDMEEMIVNEDGDLTTNFSAKPIKQLVNERVDGTLLELGIDYVWTDQTARDAQVGMVTGEKGLQNDVKKVYNFNGTIWVELFDLNEFLSTLWKLSDTTSGFSIQFDLTALTADRILTFPDYDVLVGGIKDKEVDDTSIANDFILVYKTASGKLEYEAKPIVSLLGSLDTSNMMILEERTGTGVNAGSSSAGVQTRGLNTTVLNNIAGASRSGSQAILPTGVYYIEGDAPSSQGRSSRLFVQNITTATKEAFGDTGYQDNTIPGNVKVSVLAPVVSVVAATEAIELQQYIELAVATHGLGRVISSSGDGETWARLKIWKVG